MTISAQPSTSRPNMSPVIRTLNAIIRAHPRLIVAAWLLIVVAAIPFTLHESKHLTLSGYEVPGSQSVQVEGILKKQFPNVGRAHLAVLLWPRKGATARALDSDIHEVHTTLSGLAGVTLSHHDEELALFSTGLVEPVILPLELSVGEIRTQAIAATLRDRLKVGKTTYNNVDIHLLGEGALWAGLDETSRRQLASAEKIGFPILLLVLLTIFGSLSAAVLPLILAAVSVIVTGALIYFLSLTMQLSVFVTDTASMVGIGVAVDYSLIVLARVRQELQGGRDLQEAREIALATSGTAVMFSGLVVIASLMGLWTIPNGTLRSISLGAITVVAVSVIASLTLLPTLIGLFGARRLTKDVIASRRRRKGQGGVQQDPSYLRWSRWAHTVTGHPVYAIVGAGVLLVALCLPVLQIQTSTGALQQLAPSSETRIGFTEAAKVAGPGSVGPTNVVVHLSSHQSTGELKQWVSRIRATISRLPHVAELGTTYTAPAGRFAEFTVTPTVDPESPAAKGLVKYLRTTLATTLHGSGVTAIVGGTSASLLDEEQEIATNLWKVIAAVLILAFLTLMILLRSLLLPLKAVVMNLISVGAAYGVLVIVFQWGWFDAIFGYKAPGHVETLVLPLVLAIVFGLSMDYEVFLLTRIKERWLATGDSRGAVTAGLATSAKTISSAAFVLVCVFGIFVWTGLPTVKEIGLGAAVAIGLDATVIRLVLVPATMRLLGDWSWWWPMPFARPRSTLPLSTSSDATVG
jgi:uncharacterized membrane protein YdfJ with MMPL/SSD domain